MAKNINPNNYRAGDARPQRTNGKPGVGIFTYDEPASGVRDNCVYSAENWRLPNKIVYPRGTNP